MRTRQRAPRLLWLVWLCLYPTVYGCSGTRVHRAFCEEDCRENYEEDCKPICNLDPPPDAADLDSAQTPQASGDSGTPAPKDDDPSKAPAAMDDTDGEDSDAMSDEKEPVATFSCGSRCSAALCDTTTGMCGRCTEDDQCPEAFAYCQDGDCVGCIENEHCASAETPYCALDGNLCVECLEHEHCTSPERAQCTDNHCIPCTAAEHCTSPDFPVCEANVCSGCQSDDDCTRFGDGNGVCDLTSGACVECTEQAADACCVDGPNGCEARVCASETATCTDRMPGSALPCERCIADAECMEGHACVKQQFNSDGRMVELEGHYCLPLATTDACFERAPFSTRVEPVTTVSGTETVICGLRSTTCPAYTGHEADTCTAEDAMDPEACGYPGLKDAFCDLYESSSDGNVQVFLCKMRCIGPPDCKEGYDCINSRCEPRLGL